MRLQPSRLARVEIFGLVANHKLELVLFLLVHGCVYRVDWMLALGFDLE